MGSAVEASGHQIKETVDWKDVTNERQARKQYAAH